MVLKKSLGVTAMAIMLFSMVACSKDDDQTPTFTADPGQSMTVGAVTWASRNVDAVNTFAGAADMYTSFYQFNRNVAWPASGTVTGWNETIIEDLNWTPANNPCPTGWRLPTRIELTALDALGSTWVEAYARGNAVAGRYYGPNHATCSLTGDMTGCIFLPAAGLRSSNGVFGSQGVRARFWSSRQSHPTTGYNMMFTSTESTPDLAAGVKALGLSVRCVR